MAWWWLAILAGCRTATPVGRSSASVPSGTIAAHEAFARGAGSPSLPLPVVGLHLLDRSAPDEPDRRGPFPEIVARPFAAGLPPTAAVHVSSEARESGPALLREAAARRDLSTRLSEMDRLRDGTNPLGTTSERFGRGLSRGTEWQHNFSFLRVLDRFHVRAPSANDPLETTRADVDCEERTRFFRARAKRTVTSHLHDGVEDLDTIGPVVSGVERLPQTGILAIESVADRVVGDERTVDFGELRLRVKGTALQSPSRMVALNYSLGPFGANVYWTQARVQVSRRVGGYRIALRGSLDYGEPVPAARIEVGRRLGDDWRVRLTGGNGVGFYSIPVFTEWPGDEESSAHRTGAVLFFERRF